MYFTHQTLIWNHQICLKPSQCLKAIREKYNNVKKASHYILHFKETTTIIEKAAAKCEHSIVFLGQAANGGSYIYML